MGSLRLFVAGVIACAWFTAPSVFAGQRGHHPDPPTPPPTSSPATTPSSATSTSAAHSSTSHVAHAPQTVPQKITANPALAARLQPLLPSGMTLANAASGFKNQGQFIAALHVSKNLNISFTKLKADMTGTDHDSLGQAIHDLQPTTNVKSAVKTAEQQAKADIKATKPSIADTDKGDR